MARLATLIIFALLIVNAYSLSFKNLKCDGGDCAFVVDSLKFEKYALTVKGKNTSDKKIYGGEVHLDVDYWLVLTWVTGYDGIDPTCSYNGTDCNGGVLVGPKEGKEFTLTMGDQVPPSGSFRGSADFYYLNEEDTARVHYASVSMEWKCSKTECY